MAYKLGKERRKTRTPENTPIFRKKLDKGILGEANMDGSIYISKDIPKGSALEKRVIRHESVHAKEMKEGRIEYGDDFIRDGNNTYLRQTRNGKDMVKVNGEWYEVGDRRLSWEKRAKKAE